MPKPSPPVQVRPVGRPGSLMRQIILTLLIVLLLVAGVVGVTKIQSSAPREYRQVEVPAEGYTLAGFLSEGDSPVGPYVILVHGNRPDGQAHPLYQAIRGALRPEVTVLAIDLRGFGASELEGSPGPKDGFDRLTDLQAAAEYLKGEFGARAKQIVLIGHSLGALQVLRAARESRFRSVIAIGPADFRLFLDPESSRREYLSKYQQVTGIRFDEKEFIEQASRFVPQALFQPCPETPIVLVFGQRDIREALSRHASSVLSACGDGIEQRTILLADHMYGTEDDRLPEPMSGFLARSFTGMLAITLNSYLGE